MHGLMILFHVRSCKLTDKRFLQVSTGLFSVHAMLKLKGGDTGSLSISLSEKILALSKKVLSLFCLCCF